MRWRWLTVGVVVAAGCQTLLTPVAAPPLPAVTGPATRPADPPRVQQPPLPGPAAAAPVAKVTGTPAEPPAAEEDDSLTLAAECLGRKDQAAAAVHLAAYVRQNPDQVMFRAELAELLFRLDRPADARVEFERFVAAAQAATGPPKAHLVHCHTRLMEIGQQADDPFAEAFHRGVGLLLLVGDGGGKMTDADAGTGEEILCRATLALAEAAALRPSDPRTHLYLADAHTRMGNRRAARTCLAVARNLATPGTLTPAESARLSLSAGAE